MDAIVELVVSFLKVLIGSQPSTAMTILETLISESPEIAKLISDIRAGVADDNQPLVQQLDKILAAGDEAGKLLEPSGN